MSEQLGTRSTRHIPIASHQPEPTIFEHLGLTGNPFPDDPLAGPGSALPGHRQVLADLQRWLAADPGTASGIGIVGAGPGLGKTRLLGDLIAELAGQEDRLIGVIPDDGTRRSDAQFVRSALVAFGGRPTGRTGLELTTELRALLADHVADPQDPVLLVDHAAFAGSQLEILRSLLGPNAEGASPHLQIVLFGPVELADRIARRRSLAGFVQVSARLEPLDREATALLIRDRMQAQRDADGGSLFDERAIERVWQLSRGVPGEVIRLAHRCLVEAIARQADRVDAGLVEIAAAVEGETPMLPTEDTVLQTRLALPEFDTASGATSRRRRQHQ